MSVWRENPTAEIRWLDGRWWQELPGDDEWVHLGFCPAPTNAWQTFCYHVWHGLLMRYPLWDILTFSWQNRFSFLEAGGLEPSFEMEVSHAESW
jgi:hypothetical protein